MKRTLIAIAVLIPAVASADWTEERKWFDGGGDEFAKTYGFKPKLVMLEKDLDGKVVDPDEVARRPASITIGTVCTQVLRDLQPWALKNGEPNDVIMKAFSHVDTVTCQYAHYFKGRDKPIDTGAGGTLRAGNPDDKNEPPEDCKLTFEGSGGRIKAIHIIMNRHLGDMHLRGEVITAAMKKQFPG